MRKSTSSSWRCSRRSRVLHFSLPAGKCSKGSRRFDHPTWCHFQCVKFFFSPQKDPKRLTLMQAFCYSCILLGTFSLFFIDNVEKMVIRALVVVFYIFCVCIVQALKNLYEEEALGFVWPNQVYSYASIEFPSYGSFAKYEQLSLENERHILRK